jgi:hypothetical protein
VSLDFLFKIHDGRELTWVVTLFKLFFQRFCIPIRVFYDLQVGFAIVFFPVAS